MVIMEQDDVHIRSLQLSSVPKSTRDILSNLLNPEKVLPAEGQLCRDWRGLADLVGLTSQVQASIRNSADQTAKVLQLWGDHNSVKVGELLDYLEMMDRFDVFDDIREDLLNSPVARRDQIVGLRDNLPRLITEEEEEDEVLTYDDSQGYKHLYDAYVLYSDQDKYFVESMIDYLDPRGFKICTKEKLLPGHTKYPSLAKLISERCQRIILVYSPDFLHSPAETFFRDYAQAISIESRKNKIIPIMYRDCHLPAHLAVYHNLRYESEMYSFWNKLTITLNNTKLARITAGHSPVQPRQIQMSQSHSALNIVEVSASNLSFPNVDEDRLSQISAPPSPFAALEGSSPEGSIASDTSEVVRQKKSAKIIKFFKLHRKNKRNKSKDEEGL